MKSIDKLREMCKYRHLVVNTSMTSDGTTVANLGSPLVEMIDDIIGNIEAEIAANYLELPKDADGVPIHVGDNLHSDETGRNFPCRGYNLTLQGSKKWWTVECCYDSYSGTSEYVSAKSCHHAKPNPLNELLDDVSKGINCYPRERITGYLDWNITTAEAVMLDVRDRLRELLGGE